MKKMVERGKFIVLYGANNLGKSTQTEMLVEGLKELGIDVQRVKYPVYDLAPTGPMLNEIIREKKHTHLTEEEIQKIYVQNRWDFQSTLIADLEGGRWYIGEDYIGTGKAWGMARGLTLPQVEAMNHGLLEEDLAILLYGNRFETGRELTHRNETNHQLWNESQGIHLALADRYGWEKVAANQSKERVHQEIMGIVRRRLLEKND